ncbi:MAG: hypothetical protein JOS17DRAFT_607927 [Linnemannia elongata]|nr:MAG: hypothetical protein JOS17DRAFT_607927 [Linnemannia elongata]
MRLTFFLFRPLSFFFFAPSLISFPPLTFFFHLPIVSTATLLGSKERGAESICSLSISFSLSFLRWEHKKKTCPSSFFRWTSTPLSFSSSLLFLLLSLSSFFPSSLLWDRVLLPCPAFFYPAILPVTVPCAAR